MRAGRASAVEILTAGPVTRQATGRLVVESLGQGFTEITRQLSAFVADTGVRDGVAVAFCRHTSASLVIQENADPDVRLDLATALDRLAPRDVAYVHDSEGPDDMPGHIRAMLTGPACTIPIVGGRLALGTWQGVYLAEHRDAPHRREIVIAVSGS